MTGQTKEKEDNAVIGEDVTVVGEDATSQGEDVQGDPRELKERTEESCQRDVNLPKTEESGWDRHQFERGDTIVE